MFFFASLPGPPFMATLLIYDDDKEEYWLMFFFAVIFCTVCLGFVWVCYKGHDQKHKPIALGLLKRMFGERQWITKHCNNDFLFVCWVMYWGSVVTTLGSLALTLNCIRKKNDRQFYIWFTSFINMLLFWIGSAYYCAGSYGDHGIATVVKVSPADSGGGGSKPIPEE